MIIVLHLHNTDQFLYSESADNIRPPIFQPTYNLHSAEVHPSRATCTMVIGCDRRATLLRADWNVDSNLYKLRTTEMQQAFANTSCANRIRHDAVKLRQDPEYGCLPHSDLVAGRMDERDVRSCLQ